ncbi:MAG TPA: hypothetical protein V6D20_11160 [Candidatus Obscuribacterales bacterium]
MPITQPIPSPPVTVSGSGSGGSAPAPVTTPAGVTGPMPNASPTPSPTPPSPVGPSAASSPSIPVVSSSGEVPPPGCNVVAAGDCCVTADCPTEGEVCFGSSEGVAGTCRAETDGATALALCSLALLLQ